MKLKWLFVVALLVVNGFLGVAFYEKIRAKQEEPPYTAALKEKTPVASNPAKNAVVPDQIQADQSKNYVFRKANWGMSKEDVKKADNGKPTHEEDSILMYSDKISGLDVSYAYLFTNGKLFRGAYIFNQKHTNENDYISDYDQIKSEMIEKYGQPKKDEVNWKNNLYKSNPQKYGFAVSLGHLMYYSTWETNETNIILELKGDNYEINMQASYWSKEIKGTNKASGF